VVNFFSYKIVPGKELILGYVSGRISWKEVIKFKYRLTLDKNYNPNFNIIDDIRDVDIILKNNNDVLEFIEFAKKNGKFIGSRKSAIITNSPNQVVNSEILNSFNKDLPIEFKTFSTLIAAIDWIEISLSDKQLIESYFDELKTQPNMWE